MSYLRAMPRRCWACGSTRGITRSIGGRYWCGRLRCRWKITRVVLARVWSNLRAARSPRDSEPAARLMPEHHKQLSFAASTTVSALTSLLHYQQDRYRVTRVGDEYVVSDPPRRLRASRRVLPEKVVARFRVGEDGILRRVD